MNGGNVISSLLYLVVCRPAPTRECVDHNIILII